MPYRSAISILTRTCPDRRATSLFLLLLLALLVPSPCAARQNRAEGDQPERDGNQVAAAGEIALRVLSFGVGNSPRPGDWTGILCELKDSASKPREVVVSIAIKDQDGDTTEYVRAVTTNPGSTSRAWIYARLPFTTQVGEYVRFVVRESSEETSDSQTGSAAGSLRGRVLGSTTYEITASQLLSAHVPMTGVVGRSLCGLDQYTLTCAPGEDYPRTGHEVLQPVGGLTPDSLPDRWMGLMPFESLVWTGGGVSEQPSLLSADQAKAITEWIERGGHLVVVLPPVGQAWIGAASNPLAGILPVADVARAEGLDLAPFRYLFTIDDRPRLPANAVVQYLAPARNATAYEAMRILDAPVGEPTSGEKCVVIRRLLGAGAVTLIGLDLASRELTTRQALEADVFWHRVLGKRLLLVPPSELDAKARSGQYVFAGRRPRLMDDAIQASVKTTAHAAVGLLLAFVTFVAYWALACPIGYFGLRQRKAVHHSWVAFVAGVAVFTAVAWTGATLSKPRNMPARHLTLIDHVYGQSPQRARSWASFFLPSYGEETISLVRPGDEPESSSLGVRPHQAVAPWDPPPRIDSFGNPLMAPDRATFPDSRSYSVSSREPSSLTVPTRATTKFAELDWSGMSAWSMPAPVPPLPSGAESSPIQLGSEIRLVPRQRASPRERDWTISGSIVHNLPADLTSVVVIVVRGQQGLGRAQPGSFFADASAASFQTWKPGEAKTLDSLFSPTPTSLDSAREFFASRLLQVPRQEEIDQQQANAGSEIVDSGSLDDIDVKLLSICFMSMLEPPAFDQRNNFSDQPLARRRAAHTFDLSRWFTQPCVIVVGQLIEAECPYPVYVNGERVPTSGRTVVRWVYPLAERPPEYKALTTEAGGAGN